MNISVEQFAFLELIKASLFNTESNIPENVDWDKVYEIAKKQCIVALIEPVVPTEYRNKWQDIKYQNMAQNARVIYEQNKLFSIFQEQAIPMVLIKGMAAAMYYPDPARRTMGDIDFYVPQEGINSAYELMEKNGYYLVNENYRHKRYDKNGIEFELHNKVGSRSYNDIEHIIANGIKHITEYNVNGSVFYGLPIYENGLILLGHIMQHLKGSGVGFRQIIDWMMFVDKGLDDDGWEKHFKKNAEEAGLEKLAITITYLCKKWLGLSKSISWCNEADDKLADMILERIFIDGNFGIGRSATETVISSVKDKGLIKHLQYTGMKNWKIAKKHRCLRPFAWIYQLCRYICKCIVRMIHGENVFRRKKPGMELEEIWKKLE